MLYKAHDKCFPVFQEVCTNKTMNNGYGTETYLLEKSSAIPIMTVE